jgi:hypothetical protein
MIRRRWTSVVIGTILLTSLFCEMAFAQAQAKDIKAQLAAAKKNATKQTYQLRYTFKSGEALCWKVKHLGTTETTVQGNTQTSKMRSISKKVWEVTDVDADGNATFTHSVASIDMWQKVSDREEVRYNSETDATPPPEYVQAAKSVGVPIAQITVTPWGKVIGRDKATKKSNFGLGDITVPLPVEPVELGQKWQVSNDVQVRRADGQVKRIKTRIVYTLKSVKTGVATIAVNTEVLTPVNDPKIEAQLVQQVTNGHVKFDIDAGQILSREIDWDETVVGFSGDDSLMKYLARFTEELLPSDKTVSKQGPVMR